MLNYSPGCNILSGQRGQRLENQAVQPTLSEMREMQDGTKLDLTDCLEHFLTASRDSSNC